MFIGYQNDKIAFVADTREELENLPCVILDKIEETGVEYVLHNGEYKPKAEVDVETQKEETESRIAELKAKLADTDYVAIKIAEGSATASEYADVIAQRKAWRAEINELESVDIVD